jgi:DNA-binding MarR family transcriptional regulator
MVQASSRRDLTFAQLSALARIEQYGPLRLDELATRERATAPSVIRTIALLAEDGLIAREPDPADRRAQLLLITDHGRKVIDRIRRERSELIAARTARLTDDQSAVLAPPSRSLSCWPRSHRCRRFAATDASRAQGPGPRALLPGEASPALPASAPDRSRRRPRPGRVLRLADPPHVVTAGKRTRLQGARGEGFELAERAGEMAVVPDRGAVEELAERRKQPRVKHPAAPTASK